MGQTIAASPPRFGVRAKLIVAAAAVVAAINGVAMWRALANVEAQVLADARQRVRLVNYAVERTAVNLMLSGEPDRLQIFVSSLKGHSDIADVRILDREGTVVASSVPSELRTRLSLRGIGLVVPSERQRIIAEHAGEGHFLTVVSPVRNEPMCHRCHSASERFNGTFVVSISIDPLVSRVSGLRRYQLATGTGAVAAMIGALWVLISVMVSRPINRFMSAISQVRRGDLSAVVDVRQRDELGALAQHFNAMVGEIHQARERLEEYHRREIAQAGRLASLGEMLSGLAHEIRNPLAGIIGAMAVFEQSMAEEDPRREVVREVGELVRRLGKTADAILTYARPSPPSFEPIDIHQLLDYSLFLVGADKPRTGVEIVREYAPSLPALVGDPKQLQQVFVNLLLNALQAVGERGRIVVSTADGMDGGVRVTVADDGPGIDPAHRDSIFEPFFTTKANGTGLGLAISRRLLEAHGATISLEDRPKGTAFVVHLPGPPPKADLGRQGPA